MRINFFGGPGSGKSTTTARIFAELKERNVSVEHVSEYVKAWAYLQRPVRPLDQVYLFGKQQQYEYRFLSAGVKNVVTDSPCFLCVVYAGLNVPSLVDPLAALCRVYDDAHPVLNVFLRRGDKAYVQEGRYQNYQQACEMDDRIYNILQKHYGNTIIEHDFKDRAGILATVLASVDQ